jgi:predicted SnoaL-like aldol condensation-catalyzing enzyme
MITHLMLGAFPVLLAGFASAEGPAPKQQIEIVRELLKSLETKDPKPSSSYISSSKYIQHNLPVADGPAGLKQLISRLPDNTAVNTVRIFADEDFVVAQSEYEFFGPKVGVRRFSVRRWESC